MWQYPCYIHPPDIGGPKEEIEATEAPNSEAIGSIAIVLMCTLPVLIIALDLISLGMWLMTKLENPTGGTDKVVEIHIPSTWQKHK